MSYPFAYRQWQVWAWFSLIPISRLISVVLSKRGYFIRIPDLKIWSFYLYWPVAVDLVYGSICDLKSCGAACIIDLSCGIEFKFMAMLGAACALPCFLFVLQTILYVGENYYFMRDTRNVSLVCCGVLWCAAKLLRHQGEKLSTPPDIPNMNFFIFYSAIYYALSSVSIWFYDFSYDKIKKKDNRSLILIQEISLGNDIVGRLDHMASDGKRRLFVSNLGHNSIAVVDLFAGKTVHIIIDGLDNPQGLIYDAKTALLVVANAGNNKVLVFDAANYDANYNLSYYFWLINN